MDEQIGHYRIVKELGRGAMGVVYLAHDESLDREVAVKVLEPSLAGGDEDFRRFRQEAQGLARLNHRNIVQIYFVGEDAGRHFFAMEYVPASVQQMLRHEGQLDSARAAQLVLNAANGLAAAHERGIVHRDVKPANLLVAEDGTLKIADFGIALMAAAATRLTAADAILGTPRYISPEQCEGADGDARSDIYSLGVTYYEMLSGRAPFRSTSAIALVREILHETPPPIEEVMPEIDHRTRAIVGKMMAKRADDRYQSAAAVAADLQAHLLSSVMPDWDGRSRLQTPAGATVPLAARPAEAPPPLPAPVAQPSLEAVADTGTWAGSGDAPTIVTGGAAATRRRSAWPLLAALLAILLVGGAAATTLWQGGAVRDALASATGAMKGLLGQSEGGSEPSSDTPELAAAAPKDVQTANAQPAHLAAGSETAGNETAGPEAEAWSPLAGEVEIAAASPPVEPTGGPRSTTGTRGIEHVSALADDPPPATAASSPRPPAAPETDTRPPAGIYRAVAPRGVALAVWGDDPLIAGALEDYLRPLLGSELELVSGPTLAEVVVEGQLPPGTFVQAAHDQGARHVVMATTTFLREVPLEYYGHRDVVYRSQVTLESVDTASQELLTQWKGTVQYNAIQTEHALSEALEEPLAEMIASLRR